MTYDYFAFPNRYWPNRAFPTNYWPGGIVSVPAPGVTVIDQDGWSEWEPYPIGNDDEEALILLTVAAIMERRQ